jgi:hypothetical protein
MRKLMKKTMPSVPRNRMIVIGPLNSACPNGVSPLIWPPVT